MDKFNVIDQISTLDDLERDFVAWSNMPYVFRRHSDDDCIRKHGMTNLEYYEKRKAELLNGKRNVNYIGESFSLNYDDYDNKVAITNQYTVSPNIVILIPGNYKNEDELLHDYESYTYLGFKNRLMSDEYSRQIWGYTVSDIFTYEKERLQSGVPENDGIIAPDINNGNIIEAPIEESANIRIINESRNIDSNLRHLMAKDDKIGLLQNRIHQYYSNIPESIRETYNEKDYLIRSITEQMFDEDIYYYYLPDFNPYFTMNEMVNNTTLGSLDYQTWKANLKEAVEQGDAKKIINLGWNPSVDLDYKPLHVAKIRQLTWLRNNVPTIVDIEGLRNKFDKDSSILTSTKKELNKICEEKDLYPIFFLVSQDKYEFKEIAISLSSDIKQVYYFDDNFNTLVADLYIHVFCIFVDLYTFDTIKDKLSEINVEDFKVNCLLNMYNLNKIGSYQEEISILNLKFIDTLIKLVNKNDNDFDALSLVMTKINYKAKVFKVYEGLRTKYKQNYVDEDILTLLIDKNITDIKFDGNIKIDFDQIQNRAGVIESLNMINDLLKPKKFVIERFIPVRISNKGDLSIEFRKDLEQQYQETHKLLTSYNKDNLVGIKHELAHLFYMNSLIENKIKKMKKGDKEYKTLLDLRARILNDFKTYIKLVMNEDPEFDFSKYFKDSEYYNGAVTIDKNLLRLSGNMIKKFLTKIF